MNGTYLYLGVDPSLTGTGVVVVNSTYAILLAEKLTTQAYNTQRLFLLELLLREVLEKYKDKIKLGCIESASYNSEGKLYELGEWAGVLKLVLYKYDIPLLKASPLQVKKYVSGKGENIKKDLVMLNAYKNFGVEFDDDNKCDAYILSRIARDYHGYYIHPESKITVKKYQEEVLDKINQQEKKENKKKLL